MSDIVICPNCDGPLTDSWLERAMDGSSGKRCESCTKAYHNPYGAAAELPLRRRQLVETGNELARVTGDLTTATTALEAAQAQISALKVEVAAMMKERDRERQYHIEASAMYGEAIRERDADRALLDKAQRERAEARRERDALREEVARLRAESNERGAIAAASDAEAETLEAKLGQAVAALRDAVKHCRQCNGIGKYWPHCDACADSTCDHECPPQRLCGVCAEWRAILADADSAAAGDYVRELEAVYEAAKYVQTRRIEHGRDAYAENALFDALTRLEIAKSRRGGGEGAK